LCTPRDSGSAHISPASNPSPRSYQRETRRDRTARPASVPGAFGYGNRDRPWSRVAVAPLIAAAPDDDLARACQPAQATQTHCGCCPLPDAPLPPRSTAPLGALIPSPPTVVGRVALDDRRGLEGGDPGEAGVADRVAGDLRGGLARVDLDAAAPMRMPTPWQLTRSFVSFVSFVMVAPQESCLALAWGAATAASAAAAARASAPRRMDRSVMGCSSRGWVIERD
jgi:hypothetical protein